MIDALPQYEPLKNVSIDMGFLLFIYENSNRLLMFFHSMIKFLLICPTSALEKIFNPQNILYIPAVKNCFRLEFEQIP
jgi:hypothetical protein